MKIIDLLLTLMTSLSYLLQLGEVANDNFPGGASHTSSGLDSSLALD